MAKQRKLQARPKSIDETGRLNDALAILAAHRRDAILEAVAMSAKELLRSADLEQSLPKVIERIGQATDVDRVHILEIDPATLDQGHIVQHHLWSASGISTPPHFQDAKGAVMIRVGLESWLRRLAKGNVVVGHVREFEKPVCEFFESAGVRSAMAVPVFADGHLWGHIGLDACRDEREWSPAEIDTLKTLAELIGATVSARRHEAILEAVAMSAKELLRTPNLQQSFPQVIERLGQATGVDRVHLIEIDANTSREHSPVVQHYVWSAPGVSSSINYADIKEPMAEVGLGCWVPRLIRGETVVGNTRDFEPAARTLFERGNVKSAMAVPVFVDGQWWGLIAFDECRFERHWEAADIDTFKTLAELVGAAIARARNLETLADATRIVEHSATALYRLYPQEPFPLTFLSQNFKRFGYEPEQLLTQATDWRQLVNKEDIPAVSVNLKSLAEGKVDSIRSEFRFKKPDGSWIWFANDARTIHAEGRLIAIEGIITDITERKSAAHRRDVILEAVAASAKELLRASDLQQSLPRVIQRIGEATGVDRAHIFEVDTSTPAGRVLQHYLWSAPGVPTSPVLATVKGAAMAEVGFGPWLPRLAKGETIVGHVRDFEEPVRDLFSKLGTQSVLTVPVRVDGHWWGHLGLDDCRTDREWSPTEVDTLETLAELVGAAVARTLHLKTLADANRIVENSATILYRLDLKPPFPLTFVSQNVSRYGYQADELMADPERWAQLIDPADLRCAR